MQEKMPPETNALDAAVARLMEATGVDTSDSGDRDDDTSAGSDGSLEPTPTPPPASKKRKPVTYYQRKSEIELLQEQVKNLERELARRVAVPTIENGALGDAWVLRALYAREIEKNALRLAGTQSLLTSFNSYSATAPVPLKSHLHLPADPQVRDLVLSSMREQKLRAATRFMAERTRFLDLRLGQRQGEVFDLPNGDLVTWGFDVTPFTGGHSLRQVYDELLYFIGSEEISISESLDVLTVRESEDQAPALREYGECRFVSTFTDGLDVESNMAFFLGCQDALGGDNTQPYAISVAEFIDEDELYPYRPDRYGRRDVVGVCMLKQIPADKEGDDHIVAMCRWSHVHFQRQSYPTAKATHHKAIVQDTVAALCTFMPKILAERLAMREPER